MTKKLLTFFAFLSATLFLNAQCGPSQNNTSTFLSAVNSVGQAFTTVSSCSGTLTSITVNGLSQFMGPVNDAIITLYEGNGSTGNVLGTLTGISLNSNNVFDFSGQSIAMEVSTEYTIWIDKNGATTNFATNVGFSGANPTTGSLWSDGNEFAGFFGEFIVSIDDSTLSVNDVDANETKIHAYPNPAKNNIQITALLQEENYIVFDVYGKKVIAGTVKENEAINIEKLVGGIYFIQLNKKVLKFIKE